MKALFRIIFTILMIFFNSCSREVKDIFLQGIVTDGKSNPISGAEIVVLCKKDVGFLRDEIYYDKIEIYTDKQGYFANKFDQGYELNIAVRADGYNIKTVIINELSKRDTVSTYITLEDNPFKNNKAILYDKIGLKLGIKKREINNKEIIDKWGINVVTGKNSVDTTEVTIWMQNENHLTVQKGGGVIPILRDKQEQYLLSDLVIAPSNDYQPTYKIIGQELGYFIKTNENMYAKLILSGSFEVVGPDYDEVGYSTIVIYQPDTSNILDVTQNIDLEQLLLRKN